MKKIVGCMFVFYVLLVLWIINDFHPRIFVVPAVSAGVTFFSVFVVAIASEVILSLIKMNNTSAAYATAGCVSLSLFMVAIPASFILGFFLPLDWSIGIGAGIVVIGGGMRVWLLL